MLLPAVALAQSPPLRQAQSKEGREARRAQMKSFAEAWKLADADGDGSISQAEFSKMPKILELPEEKRGQLFQRLDKDADGKLSREEISRFGRPHGEGAPMKRLWELDADRSGGISFTEFQGGQVFKKLPPERQQEVFKRLDTDGDGVITPKDRPEPHARRDGKPRPGGERPYRGGGDSTPQGINRTLDSDGDGALTFEEFRASPVLRGLSEDEQEDRFELIDRNKDLRLTNEDFQAAPEKSAGPE